MSMFQSDDSITSSDEEESLSDDSAPSSPKVDQTRIQGNASSRKVLAAQAALSLAYKCLARCGNTDTSLHSQGIWKEWSALSEAMNVLARLADNNKVRSVLDMDRLLSPLLNILQYHLIPLAKSKEFAKTLIKNEARALYVVLKHWKVLSLYLVPMEEEDLLKLLSTPKSILRPFFECSQHPSHTLNLTNMRLPSFYDVNKLDFSFYLRLFGIEDRSVKSVSLPIYQQQILPKRFLHSFPCLSHLDGIPVKLEFLPLYILRVSLDKDTWQSLRTGDKTNEPRIEIFANLARHPRPRRHRTLAQYTLLALDRSTTSGLDEMDLSPRLRELAFNSYKCDLCDEMCVIGSQEWLKEVRLAKRLEGGREIALRGRLCTACMLYLIPRQGKYMIPSLR